MSDASNKLIVGFKTTLQNSISLNKIARKAGDEKEYGIGVSLNILSAEEAIKAYIIGIKCFIPEIEIKNYRKYFRDHRTKHREIKSFMALFELIQVFNKNLLEPFLSTEKEMEREEILSIREKGLIKISEWVETVKNGENKINKAISWWNTANSNKNNGFYVEETENGWKSPEGVPEIDYLRSKENTEELIDRVSMINDLFDNPSLQLFVLQVKDKVLDQYENGD